MSETHGAACCGISSPIARDVHRVLPPAALARIEKRRSREGEARHAGQVCFAIEAALPLARVWRRVTPRERAIEVFGLLRVWDTEHNDGVLVYLLLADRDVEIVADRGIHAQVGDDALEARSATAMETAFRAGRLREGRGGGRARGERPARAAFAAHRRRAQRALRQAVVCS